MVENEHEGPTLATLVGKVARTGFGLLQNRSELLSVEWQEERARLTEALVWTVACLFLGMLGLGLLTAFVIVLFREDLRIYAIAGFAVLYSAGAFVAWRNLKRVLQQESFTESIAQMRKDAAWLDSLK
jgi:uncharacterized membrane protein YqjE